MSEGLRWCFRGNHEHWPCHSVFTQVRRVSIPQRAPQLNCSTTAYAWRGAWGSAGSRTLGAAHWAFPPRGGDRRRPNIAATAARAPRCAGPEGSVAASAAAASAGGPAAAGRVPAPAGRVVPPAVVPARGGPGVPTPDPPTGPAVVRPGGPRGRPTPQGPRLPCGNPARTPPPRPHHDHSDHDHHDEDDADNHGVPPPPVSPEATPRGPLVQPRAPRGDRNARP